MRFGYFFRTYNRRSAVNLLVMAELFCCFVLVAISLHLLTSEYKDTSYYFDGIDRLWYAAMTPDQYEELKGSGVGGDYPLFYRCTDADREEYESFSAGLNVFALSKSLTRNTSLGMLQGEWFASDYEYDTDDYPAVANDTLAESRGWKCGETYTLSIFDKSGAPFEIAVRIVGISDFSGTEENISVTSEGIVYDRYQIPCIYIEVPDGFDGFAYGGDDDTFRISILENDLPDRERALIYTTGAEAENVGNNAYARYSEDRAANMTFVLVFVGAMLLAASTVFTSAAVDLGIRLKESSVAYVCGMTPRQNFAFVVASCVVTFAVPFALSCALVGASVGGRFLMMDDMKAYFIVVPMIAAVYFAANAASFIAQAKSKPLDGLKEE